MGRMSQVGGDSNFVAKIAQTSFDQLKSAKDSVTKMGHSLVLGCLHRYVGGMGSGQHLQMSVSILHRLSQEVSNTNVQVCGKGSSCSETHSVWFRSGHCMHWLSSQTVVVPCFVTM